MSTTQNPTPGVDFWAAIGVTGEDAGPQPPQNGRSPAARPDAPAEDTAAWASMFSAPEQSDAAVPATEPPASQPPAAGRSEGGTAKTSPNAPPPQKVPQKAPQKAAQKSRPAQRRAEPPRAGRERPAKTATAPQSPPPPEDWSVAERLGRSLRSRIAIRPVDVVTGGHRDVWLETLKGYAGGDAVLAGKIHDVMSGWHLVGELWRDKVVDEVHIRGTQVTVCGRDGIWQVPGFPSLAAARRTIETITSAQEGTGAVVTTAGESIVVGRRHTAPGDVAALVAAEVVTGKQVAQVEEALRRVETVTVTGPAAPAIVRAFASLVPAGSRVYEGPYAVLPAGCVAVPSPLCADYVIGVRPDEEATEMAAAGQLGALIANPRTAFPATVRLAVSGRSAAPEKVSAAR